jgi:hypothetical protein
VVSRLPRLPAGQPPRVISLDNRVSVIVADVAKEVYNREAIEERLSDLDWVSSCGAVHHAVSEALFAKHLVVPLRLFTLFASDVRAVAALRRLRPRILKTFARLQDRKEFVLRVGRPDASRLDSGHVADTDADRPATGTNFLRAKATARRDAAAREARATRSAVAVFEALSAIAVGARTRTPPPGTNLLLDAAFLVDTRRSAPFRRTLTRSASDLLRDGCPVSLTGPWPPYSFASAD